jgi:uncharacterized repeat protein (TIGR03803 family)
VHANVRESLVLLEGNHEVQSNTLVQGTDGNFYGTTGGGAYNEGMVFKLTPAGKLVPLFYFDGTDGTLSETGAALVQGSDGNFYGTTSNGGAYGYGTVFKVTPAGNLTVRHSLNGTTDGSLVTAGLVQATDGNFYGTAIEGGSMGNGTIFRITPNGSFSVLHNFDYKHGALPYVTLLQHTNGVLYGDTGSGGTGTACYGPCGVFYSLNLGLRPFVSLLTTSGKAGQIVEILGQNFTGTKDVEFGSGTASLTVVSDTYMTAVVPATGTTGSVTVTTPKGPLVSNKIFRVIPTITSFIPTNGTIGTSVVIAGTGLTQTNKVMFGGTPAAKFTATATKVTAKVPTGAKTGKIVVTTEGGSASDPESFIVN